MHSPRREPQRPAEEAPRTAAAIALTELVLPTFELNGEFLAAAELITAPHELTPALWQVLGAVLDEPRTVADIARRVGLGLARQSVQRVANVLVDQGWATWQENPGHKRAKLLACTTRGRQAVRAMADDQRRWAEAVGRRVGETDLRRLAELIGTVTQASREAREEQF